MAKIKKTFLYDRLYFERYTESWSQSTWYLPSLIQKEGQGRIHTGFHGFTEICKIFQNVNSGKATVRQGTYKKNSFQFEKLCIKTRFETEVTGTREWLILCFPGQRRPIRQLRSLSQENVELKLTEYAKHAEPSKF